MEKKDSKWSAIIKENMQKGIVGDKEMTVGLLENHISQLSATEKEKVILIDGMWCSGEGALMLS